jgi:hypothetical protein
MKKNILIKVLVILFALALLTTAFFTEVSSKNTPVANASYIGDPLTGCGTKTTTMKKSGYNVFGQRLFTVRWTIQDDWCRNLRCMYMMLHPCYWGNANLSNIVRGKPTIDTTSLGLGWSVHVDQVNSLWKDRIEGGDWGYHSEYDSVLQAHLVQCLNVWLFNTCSTKKSLNWKMVVDGSGQAHVNYNWGG